MSIPFSRSLLIAGTVVLAAAAVLETGWAARETEPRVPPDAVARAEARWAPVRAELARRNVNGVIGYDAGVPPGALSGNAAAVERFYRGQFALAPRVLDPSLRQGWVVEDRPGAEPRLLWR